MDGRRGELQMNQGWLNVKHAAAYADISERTLEKWIRAGLRVSRVSAGMRLIKREWLDDYLEGYADTENNVDKIVNDVMSELK